MHLAYRPYHGCGVFAVVLILTSKMHGGSICRRRSAVMVPMGSGTQHRLAIRVPPRCHKRDGTHFCAFPPVRDTDLRHTHQLTLTN